MNSKTSNVKIYHYKLLQTAVSKFGQPFSAITPDQQLQAEQIAAKQLFIENCVLASAEASTVVITGDRTEAALAEIIARYTTEDEFSQELQVSQLDKSTLRQAVNRELLVEAAMDAVASQVPEVPATDARLYYYFHLEKFQRAETRTARHILLTINPDFPENTRAQALARITLIGKRLRKNPARFAEQAMKHSECPTSVEGGVLGQVAPGILFAELEQTLFELPLGAVSEVVESPLGFHIMQCEAIHAACVIPVDEAVSAIVEKLTLRKRLKHQQLWLRKLLQSGQHSKPSDIMAGRPQLKRKASSELSCQADSLARA